MAVASSDERMPDGPILVVDAGPTDRENVVARIQWPEDMAPAFLTRPADVAPALVVLFERQDGPEARSKPLPGELEWVEGETGRSLRLTWVVPGTLAAGKSRRFEVVETNDRDPGPSIPWKWESVDGAIRLNHRDRAVFTYNTRPVRHPDFQDPCQPRDAYIHPAYSPAGALITGDYSRFSHPHHRGIFLAYTETEVGGLHPDFWNIQNGTGKIAFEAVEKKDVGPVRARLRVRHLWQAIEPGGALRPVMTETWDLEATDIPGSPYWQLDLTSTQRATGEPIRVLPHRYGGMAYRGPDSFFPEGALDVLTSSGFDRVRGDQEPARWVDLTGPVADGSSLYAGAVLFDHPGNVNHPTPVRIHPTRLPFLSYTPSHDVTVTIPNDRELVFRYRIVIHDGRPDADRNERVWHDYSRPVEVRLVDRAD